MESLYEPPKALSGNYQRREGSISTNHLENIVRSSAEYGSRHMVRIVDAKVTRGKATLET